MLAAGANALALNDDDEAYIGLLERRGHRPTSTPVVALADHRAAHVAAESPVVAAPVPWPITVEQVPAQFDQESESTVAKTRGDDLLPGSWLDGMATIELPVVEVPAVEEPVVEVSAVQPAVLAEPVEVAPNVLFMPPSDLGPHVIDGTALPGTTFHHGAAPTLKLSPTPVESQRYRVHPRILGGLLAMVGLEAVVVVAVITTDLVG